MDCVYGGGLDVGLSNVRDAAPETCSLRLFEFRKARAALEVSVLPLENGIRPVLASVTSDKGCECVDGG